jgi:hypothetical protein
MDIANLRSSDRAIARRCSERLAKLLEARFDIRRGKLIERVAQAAPHLPSATQRRLEDLALELTQISQGLARINDRDSWRASVEVTLSAVESSGPYVRVAPRRRLGWWWHTLFLIAAAILYLNLPAFTGITPGPWVDRIATWVGMGYLYWAWDRGLQMGWPPCRARAILRCLLVLLLAASPVVIVLAALNLRDYARSKPVEFDGSSYSADKVSSYHIGAKDRRPIVNPATGLPMAGIGMDIGGDPYGTDNYYDGHRGPE